MDFDALLIDRRFSLNIEREERRPVRLTVRGGALSLDGAEVGRERHARAYVQPVEGVDDVRVCLQNADHQPTMTLELPDRASALRLLEGLGIDPEARVAFAAVRTPAVLATFLSVVLALAIGAGLFKQLGPLAIACALPLLLVALVLRLRFFFYAVHVAGDGVLVGERFISYDQIDKVLPMMSSEVTLKLAGGEELVLNFPTTDQRPNAFGWKPGRVGVAVRDAVRECIDDAKRRFHDRALPLADRLARRAREADEWLRDVDAIAAGRFRIAAAPRDDLARLAASASADPSARAAAARILVNGIATEERERLRIAANECASPELRRVLEAAAEAESVEALDEPIRALR